MGSQRLQATEALVLEFMCAVERESLNQETSSQSTSWEKVNPLRLQLINFIENNVVVNYKKHMEIMSESLVKYMEVVLVYVHTSLADQNQQRKWLSMCLDIIPAIVSEEEFKNVFVKVATAKILEMFIMDDFSTLCKGFLIKVFNQVIQKANKVVRYSLAEDLMHELYKLFDQIAAYGDFTIQSDIMEAVFRIYGSVIMSGNLKYKLVPDSEELSNALQHISYENFDIDIRRWLNRFNEKSTEIFSISCAEMKFGDVVVEAPQSVSVTSNKVNENASRVAVCTSPASQPVPKIGRCLRSPSITAVSLLISDVHSPANVISISDDESDLLPPTGLRTSDRIDKQDPDSTLQDDIVTSSIHKTDELETSLEFSRSINMCNSSSPVRVSRVVSSSEFLDCSESNSEPADYVMSSGVPRKRMENKTVVESKVNLNIDRYLFSERQEIIPEVQKGKLYPKVGMYTDLTSNVTENIDHEKQKMSDSQKSHDKPPCPRQKVARFVDSNDKNSAYKNLHDKVQAIESGDKQIPSPKPKAAKYAYLGIDDRIEEQNIREQVASQICSESDDDQFYTCFDKLVHSPGTVDKSHGELVLIEENEEYKENNNANSRVARSSALAEPASIDNKLSLAGKKLSKKILPLHHFEVDEPGSKTTMKQILKDSIYYKSGKQTREKKLSAKMEEMCTSKKSLTSDILKKVESEKGSELGIKGQQNKLDGTERKTVVTLDKDSKQLKLKLCSDKENIHMTNSKIARSAFCDSNKPTSIDLPVPPNERSEKEIKRQPIQCIPKESEVPQTKQKHIASRESEFDKIDMTEPAIDIPKEIEVPEARVQQCEDLDQSGDLYKKQSENQITSRKSESDKVDVTEPIIDIPKEIEVPKARVQQSEPTQRDADQSGIGDAELHLTKAKTDLRKIDEVKKRISKDRKVYQSDPERLEIPETQDSNRIVSKVDEIPSTTKEKTHFSRRGKANEVQKHQRKQQKKSNLKKSKLDVLKTDTSLNKGLEDSPSNKESTLKPPHSKLQAPAPVEKLTRKQNTKAKKSKNPSTNKEFDSQQNKDNFLEIAENAIIVPANELDDLANSNVHDDRIDEIQEYVVATNDRPAACQSSDSEKNEKRNCKTTDHTILPSMRINATSNTHEDNLNKNIVDETVSKQATCQSPDLFTSPAVVAENKVLEEKVVIATPNSDKPLFESAHQPWPVEVNIDEGLHPNLQLSREPLREPLSEDLAAIEKDFFEKSQMAKEQTNTQPKGISQTLATLDLAVVTDLNQVSSQPVRPYSTPELCDILGECGNEKTVKRKNTDLSKEFHHTESLDLFDQIKSSVERIISNFEKTDSKSKDKAAYKRYESSDSENAELQDEEVETEPAMDKALQLLRTEEGEDTAAANLENHEISEKNCKEADGDTGAVLEKNLNRIISEYSQDTPKQNRQLRYQKDDCLSISKGQIRKDTKSKMFGLKYSADSDNKTAKPERKSTRCAIKNKPKNQPAEKLDGREKIPKKGSKDRNVPNTPMENGQLTVQKDGCLPITEEQVRECTKSQILDLEGSSDSENAENDTAKKYKKLRSARNKKTNNKSANKIIGKNICRVPSVETVKQRSADADNNKVPLTRKHYNKLVSQDLPDTPTNIEQKSTKSQMLDMEDSSDSEDAENKTSKKYKRISRSARKKKTNNKSAKKINDQNIYKISSGETEKIVKQGSADSDDNKMQFTKKHLNRLVFQDFDDTEQKRTESKILDLEDSSDSRNADSYIAKPRKKTLRSSRTRKTEKLALYDREGAAVNPEKKEQIAEPVFIEPIDEHDAGPPIEPLGQAVAQAHVNPKHGNSEHLVEDVNEQQCDKPVFIEETDKNVSSSPIESCPHPERTIVEINFGHSEPSAKLLPSNEREKTASNSEEQVKQLTSIDRIDESIKRKPHTSEIISDAIIEIYDEPVLDKNDSSSPIGFLEEARNQASVGSKLEASENQPTNISMANRKRKLYNPSKDDQILKDRIEDKMALEKESSSFTEEFLKIPTKPRRAPARKQKNTKNQIAPEESRVTKAKTKGKKLRPIGLYTSTPYVGSSKNESRPFLSNILLEHTKSLFVPTKKSQKRQCSPSDGATKAKRARPKTIKEKHLVSFDRYDLEENHYRFADLVGRANPSSSGNSEDSIFKRKTPECDAIIFQSDSPNFITEPKLSITAASKSDEKSRKINILQQIVIPPTRELFKEENQVALDMEEITVDLPHMLFSDADKQPLKNADNDGENSAGNRVNIIDVVHRMCKAALTLNIIPQEDIPVARQITNICENQLQ